MKKLGWLIMNGSLKTKQFDEMYEMYKDAADTLDIEIERIYNDEILIGMEEDSLFIQNIKCEKEPDFVLFLDKDICLAKQLEAKGMRLFNKSDVISWCDNKAVTFQKLANHGINIPKTIIAPMHFYSPKDENEAYIAQLEKQLDYPMIVKESFGSFGEQVYLVKNRKELKEIREKIKAKPHIYQEYIKSSKGRDVRLNIVGGKLVACMERFSETDFRANIAQGSNSRSFVPPKAFEAMAIKVCEILGADFAGVDILFGEDNKPILCEVNSNAHIKGIKACTGINVAVPILQHILDSI